MLTIEHLEQKLKEISEQVTKSHEICTNGQKELERMYGNHNGLLGAQAMAQQLVNDAKASEHKEPEEALAGEVV